MVKRFWLFAGEYFYPCGGMNDFKGSFDSQEEAEAAGESRHEFGFSQGSRRYEWYHILDTEEYDGRTAYF